MSRRPLSRQCVTVTERAERRWPAGPGRRQGGHLRKLVEGLCSHIGWGCRAWRRWPAGPGRRQGGHCQPPTPVRSVTERRWPAGPGRRQGGHCQPPAPVRSVTERAERRWPAGPGRRQGGHLRQRVEGLCSHIGWGCRAEHRWPAGPGRRQGAIASRPHQCVR